MNWRETNARWDELVALAALALLSAFLALVAWQLPEAFGLWMQEDGWAEWGTFWSFLAAAVLFGRRAIRKSDTVLTRVLAFLLCAFCVFVAGEEISWGQRVFAYRPPDYFLEKNYQQELNVHNLLTKKEALGMSLDSRYLIAFIAFVYGVLAPLVVRIPRLRETSLIEQARPLVPTLWLLPIFIAIIQVERRYPVKLGGEAAELVFGMCFLVTALAASRFHFRRPAVGYALPALTVAATLLLGAATPPVLGFLNSGADQKRVAQTQAELKAIAQELATATQPRLLQTRAMHKRIHTAVEVGYFKLADPARFGYFLDPWHSPYWVRWDADNASLSIYSFGPNRRRDPDGGDDLHEVVPLAL
jgi:hypothetical protein